MNFFLYYICKKELKMNKISYKLSEDILDKHAENLKLKDGVDYAGALIDADKKMTGWEKLPMFIYDFFWKVAYNKSLKGIIEIR